MPSQMHSALCPHCGAAMYSTVGGSQLVLCSGCQWTGRVAFHYLPGNQGSYTPNPGHQQYVFGGMGALPNGTTYPILAAATPPADPTDEATDTDPYAARREALDAALSDVAEAVGMQRLPQMTSAEFDIPLWRRYERLQEQHSALFEALGGRRMGDFRADSGRVKAALIDVLLWALLTLDAVER